LDITEWNFMGRVITGGGVGYIPGGMSRKLVESVHGICFFYPPSGKLSTAFLRSFFACLHRSLVFLVVSLLQGWWCREGKGGDKNDVLVKKKKVQEKPCQKNHGIEGRF
jgi:hypothetical protein